MKWNKKKESHGREKQLVRKKIGGKCEGVYPKVGCEGIATLVMYRRITLCLIVAL